VSAVHPPGLISAPAMPSGWLRLLEGRAVWEAAALLPALPWLATAPRGDGHAVLVLPGLGAGDRSTEILRFFLRDRGHRAHGWNLGRNEGPTEAILSGVARRLAEVRREAGRPVSLIGWSLGGIYARGLARRFPSDVRQVLTLASPYNSPGVSELARAPLPVPATSLFSHTDGVVPWRACREDDGPMRESVAVPSSHLGMGHHPLALLVIADRLGQPEGAWRPYARPAGVRARERVY